MGGAPLWMPILITLVGWFIVQSEPAYTFSNVFNQVTYALVTAAWIAWFTGLW
jgi:hypothetical protein